MTATPQRAVRVTDQTWQAAQDRAGGEHRTVSDVIQTALRAYAAGRYDAVEPRRRKNE
jgi:hypothetical protein